MRRPKRHQSKAQIRCEHHRKRAKYLSEAYDDLAKEYRRADINILHAINRRDEEIRDLTVKLDHARRKERLVDEIINRAATIDFDRCENGYYQISLTFNGDFMGGISRYGEVQRHVARRVAEQIEHEIASSKFVESARQNYRQQMERGPVFRAGEKGYMENPYGH